VKGQLIRKLDAIAREHTERAVETITGIMDNELNEPRDRLAAAQAILDRGHGKPLTAVIQLPASKREAAALAAFSDEELESAIEGHVLPRLTREPDAVQQRQVRVQYAEGNDPLLD
jgi:hypothetical protein